MDHKWIKKDKIFPIDEKNLYKEFETNLRLYQKMDNFEKKIIMFIAMRLNEDEIKQLENLFVALDKDDNGTLSKSEIMAGIKKVKEKDISEEKISNIFKRVDTNDNNKLDYTEFISSIIGQDIYLNKKRLKEVFDHLDENKNGKITKINLKNVLKLEDNCLNKFDYLMEQIGKEKDDELNFDEFFKMFCKIISEHIKK